MTSPINFGGGVGTQPVIVNPGIGEQLAPLLEQLQFAQQQKQRQGALDQAQAAEEQKQQQAALTQFLGAVRTIPGFLDTPDAVDLAERGGLRPATVDNLRKTRAEKGDALRDLFNGFEDPETGRSVMGIRDRIAATGASAETMIFVEVAIADSIIDGEINHELFNPLFKLLNDQDKREVELQTARMELSLKRDEVTRSLQRFISDGRTEAATEVMRLALETMGMPLPQGTSGKVIESLIKEVFLKEVDERSPQRFFQTMLVSELARTGVAGIFNIQNSKTAFNSALETTGRLFPDWAEKVRQQQTPEMKNYRVATDFVALYLSNWTNSSDNTIRIGRRDPKHFKKAADLKAGIRDWLIEAYVKKQATSTPASRQFFRDLDLPALETGHLTEPQIDEILDIMFLQAGQ